MDYKDLFKLKFEKGLSTIELEERYPEDIDKIAKLALIDLPQDVLRKIIRDKKELLALIDLKKSAEVSRI
ncbi:MAG: hypothetical protein PHE61_03850 [Candidatus Omnitrophica bacterium]|nr:hypothetical protein [Candidatus Omnitrophota bacterium]